MSPKIKAGTLQCPSLHWQQHKWTLVVKLRILISTEQQSQKKLMEGARQRGCPGDVGSVHFVSFRDPVNLACRIFSALCDGLSTLLITFLQQNWVFRTQTEWSEKVFSLLLHLFTGLWSTGVLAWQTSLSDFVLDCVCVLHIFLLVSGFVPDISDRTMKQSSHSHHSFHSWPTVAAPFSYLSVTKEIKLQI